MAIIDSNVLIQLDTEFKQSKPITTMKELFSALYEAGEFWRAENKEIKEITRGDRKGETEEKVPVPAIEDVAKALRKYCHFTFIGIGRTTDKSPLYVFDYDTGLYSDSADLFNQLCHTFDTRVHPKTWDSIKKVVRLKTKMRPTFSDPTLIPVNNGVVNLETKKLMPFSPDYVITAKISTDYQVNPVKPLFDGKFDFDNWLSEIACHDDEVITLLWQIMNEAINPNHTRGKMAILYGEGNNGKGTFQSLLINLIGLSNVSALKPDQFMEKFKLSSLIGKVCNIGDDISSKYLDEVSDLMSIVTGDTITIEEKHLPSYEVSLKLFCLFSGNALPNARNKSQGWYRRLCIVPFNADFNGSKEIPEIKNIYLKDRQLLEWVLWKIINIKPFEKFIEPSVVTKTLDNYKKDNDFVLSWVIDVYLPSKWDEYAKFPLFLAKEKMEEYLKDSGIEHANMYGFGNRLVSHLTSMNDATFTLKVGRLNSEEVAIFDDYFNKDRLKKSQRLIIRE
ncbi:DNA primase family protein [Streptococcus iniae]|uniref:DNA primase family protein n=1 Tax=Streptococcus iniae TaxID=1346 RepID=UPI00217EC936|nr:DNA primase family protein [Streptococcus iniae]WHL20723.1 phage/plasmid primase, P4 family [Streptococcus iniae]WLR89692.1 phage/plasmid primase, P4 family [Streptococcus iniae]